MRYLIAETTWTMMTLAQTLRDTGVLLTRTEGSEDIPAHLQDGHIDLLALSADQIGHNGPSLKELRYLSATLPIVVITDTPDANETVKLLEAGADDVLPKSMPPEEMAARMHSIARRAFGQAQSSLHLGPLTIDLDRRRVFLDDTPLLLTPKLYEILEYLSLRTGALISRDDLLAHIYGFENEPDARVFDVYICSLRAALAPAGDDLHIQTVRGAGFRLCVTHSADQIAA